MKITKYEHSFLAIEDKKTVLIDPGSYTKGFDISAFEKADYLLITHEHADHMDIKLIREITAKFPKVKVMSNESVAEILAKEGIKVSTEGNDDIRIIEAKHEPILGKAPPNCLFNIFGKITHPGDSHSFSSTLEILALPITAPWGSMVAAAQLAVKLKPKIAVPIHDWHLSEEGRKVYYSWLNGYLKEKGIE